MNSADGSSEMRTKEQLEQRLSEIIAEIEVNNPYDTFEPNEFEEGKFDIQELYESRPQRLVVQKVLDGDDKELAKFLMDEIGDELRRNKH